MTDFETVLNEKGVLVYTNKGVSMMPLLRQDKDIMVIKKQVSGYRKDDVVLYKRLNGQYVLHRITEVLGDGNYIIIGDNCPNNTAEKIPDSQILGILTEIKRDGKILSMNDKKYLSYVKTVPLRRKLVPTKRFVRRGLSFAKRGVKKVLGISEKTNPSG